MKKRKIVWTLKAVQSLKSHCSFISRHSPEAAKKVRKTILESTRPLTENAEFYQLDDLRRNADDNVRRFFKWHYKIVYQVTDTEVFIIDILHTSKSSMKEDN